MPDELDIPQEFDEEFESASIEFKVHNPGMKEKMLWNGCSMTCNRMTCHPESSEEDIDNLIDHVRMAENDSEFVFPK